MLLRLGHPVARTLTAVVLTVAVAGCTSASPASSPAEPGTNIGQPLDAALPARLLNESLSDQDGKPISLGSFDGKVLVVSDMMTLCQEACPLDTANMVAAARAVEAAGLGDQVEFLSITVDPARDTGAQLAAYRKLYSPAPADWLDVRGSASAIDGLWQHLGVYIKKVPNHGKAPKNWRTGKSLTYDIEHSDEAFFFDQDGHERFLLEGVPQVATDAPIPSPISTFMDAKGRKALARPSAQAWTLPQELAVLSWLTGHDIPGSG